MVHTMKRILFFWLLLLPLLACGPEADYFDTQEATVETSNSTILPQEPARTFFYTRGPENEAETFTALGGTDFRISHSGDCEYVFDLFFRLPEGLPGREGLPRDIYYDTITSGQGDLENTWRLFLPEAEYFLDVETDCQWLVEISKVTAEGEASDDG